ncbi:pre-toxin TG domain-containing protein [Paenibacillus turicensis]|uniref:pre-toxin TG domain-containing protein n=1 Tax=Paenibacillus turicensis TaxID=160487 RepID=UPI003D2DB85A
MQIELRVSDLEELGSKLRRSGNEIEGIRSELRRAMSGLSLRSQGRAEVDSSYQMIERMLKELEQSLDRYSRGVTQKGVAFDEADGKAPPFEWGKVWDVFKVITSIVLDFTPIVSNIKAVVEALTGRDLITGAELTWYERALGLLGPLGKGLNKGAKILKATDEVVSGINKFTKATHVVAETVDNGKGIVEAITGVDMITGERLQPWQRALAAAGVTVSVGVNKWANQKNNKFMQAANEVTDDSKRITKSQNGSQGDMGSGNKKDAGGNSTHQQDGSHTETSTQNQVSNPNGTHVQQGTEATQISDPKKTEQKCMNGDPVHVGTGQQFMIHSALKLYGAATWDLQLFYNSNLLQKSELGLAWTHNYAMRLDFGNGQQVNQEAELDPNRMDTGENFNQKTDVDSPDKSSMPSEAITVWWTAGRRNVFTRQEDGVYRSMDTDVLLDELTPVGEGYELKLGSTRERYYFNENGILQRHVNRVGMALQATHDEQGILQSLQDELSGRALQFKYNQGLLAQVIDGHRQISFAYDEAGWLAELTDTENLVTSFTCDEAGRILTMSTNGKRDFTNVFDAFHRIVKQIDGKDSITTFEYDAHSRPGYFLTTVTNRAGEVEHHVYNDRHLLLEISGEEGVLHRYTYNERGQKLTESNALGETICYTYDEKGQLISFQDALGQATTYMYDNKGLLIEEQNALGAVTRYTYDEQERLTQITRPDGASCHWEYHESGALLAYHNFAGETVRYQYDDSGYIQVMQDGEGRQTTILIDEVGRMAGTQDVYGGTLLRTYNDDDKLTLVKDALGRTWRYEYNLDGKVTKISDPTGGTISYTYTAMGKVETTTDPLGNTHRYTYDGEDRLIAEEDARGGITRLRYDGRGRVASVTDALDRTITYKYDATGRLESVFDALGQPVQTLTYDANGQPIAISNALGHTTERRFNALYQPVEQTSADGIKTEYHYDELARLQEVIEDSEQWRARYTQSYDAEHRLTKYQDANGNETTLMYNRTGQVVEEKNSTGHGLSYTYDERGLLASKQNARGQQEGYTYDAAGQLISMTDEVGQLEIKYDEAGRWVEGKETGSQAIQATQATQTIRRSYDALGRLTEQWDVWGQRIGYAYDEVGNLTHLTYPDGKVVEYRYNLGGELIEVKDWAGRLTRYRYDGNGRLIETNRPNGTKERRSYDVLGQLLRQQDVTPQGILLQDLKYEYNEVGQIVKEQNKQYTYDQLRRLVSGANQGKITYYHYDLGGNLTEQNEVDTETGLGFEGTRGLEETKGRLGVRGTNTGDNLGELGQGSSNTIDTMSVFSYSADNRLRRIGNYPTEHDADGNLLYFTDGEKMAAYEYDARNRLIQTGRMKYRYNWRNERIESIWRGKVTRYVVDDLSAFSRVLMELDGEGNVLTRYVYGLGLIGREDATTGTYQSYHSDLRGSTTILTNEHGLVTDRYAYGIYGEVDHFEGNTSQPFQYNGRDGVMHDINGLYYMRARYYHTELKRFLNRDVIRGNITEGQTFNRYAYVNGDPVRYVDPLGLARLGCEVFDEAKIPRTSEEWNEYFKKQYGDGNVAKSTASFSPDLEVHLKYVDSKVPRSRGIGGAHNKEEFYRNGVNILNVEKHPLMPEVEKVTYQIPSIDGKTGQVTGWKAKEYLKTIYDPKVMSDEEYIRLGKEAANNAHSKGKLGREWDGYDKNGVKWMGYTDSSGTVTSFFPEF